LLTFFNARNIFNIPPHKKRSRLARDQKSSLITAPLKKYRKKAGLSRRKSPVFFLRDNSIQMILGGMDSGCRLAAFAGMTVAGSGFHLG
jgi:hypothetical protein